MTVRDMAIMVRLTKICFERETPKAGVYEFIPATVVADKLDELDRDLFNAKEEIERLTRLTQAYSKERIARKQGETVNPDRFEIVRPDPRGRIVWGGRTHKLVNMSIFRGSFICWLWSCGPHGEVESESQLWFDDASVYPYRMACLAVNPATRVGAVMRKE